MEHELFVYIYFAKTIYTKKKKKDSYLKHRFPFKNKTLDTKGAAKSSYRQLSLKLEACIDRFDRTQKRGPFNDIGISFQRKHLQLVVLIPVAV